MLTNKQQKTAHEQASNMQETLEVNVTPNAILQYDTEKASASS